MHACNSFLADTQHITECVSSSSSSSNTTVAVLVPVMKWSQQMSASEWTDCACQLLSVSLADIHAHASPPHDVASRPQAAASPYISQYNQSTITIS